MLSHSRRRVRVSILLRNKLNGYGDDKPRVEKEIESITIGEPKKGWCPDDFLGKEFFVISFK